jgi:hypothetical protein
MTPQPSPTSSNAFVRKAAQALPGETRFEDAATKYGDGRHQILSRTGNQEREDGSDSASGLGKAATPNYLFTCWRSVAPMQR